MRRRERDGRREGRGSEDVLVKGEERGGLTHYLRLIAKPRRIYILFLYTMVTESGASTKNYKKERKKGFEPLATL